MRQLAGVAREGARKIVSVQESNSCSDVACGGRYGSSWYSALRAVVAEGDAGLTNAGCSSAASISPMSASKSSLAPASIARASTSGASSATIPARAAATSRSSFTCGIARHRILVGDDERFVDQRREDVEHRPLVERGVLHQRLGRFHRKAAGEDTEPAEHDPLLLAQQAVAPIERGPERLVAAQRRPRATGQQPEARVELVAHDGEAQGRHARGGELDRERQAVELAADVDGEAEAVVVEAKARIGGAGRALRAARWRRSRACPRRSRSPGGPPR
jgi:hypothetical protein